MIYHDVLSLGAGVQSSAVLLMSCRGELPKLELAVFGDTGWEPPKVYENLEFLKTEAKIAGIPLLVRDNGNLRDRFVKNFVLGSDGERYASLPIFTLNPDGSLGMIRRMCTDEHKAKPVERAIKQELMGLKKGQRFPVKEHHINHWFGISADEHQRMRDAKDRWRTNCYPLIGIPKDYLDYRFTRQACIDWLSKAYPGRHFPRSSCIGCPYHSQAEWRSIRSDPTMWENACRVDEAIRVANGLRGTAFLHVSRTPLRTADLGEGSTNGGLFEECSGHCFT